MKDLFNSVLGGKGPLFDDMKKTLEDPSVPVKQKVQLLAAMALPEVQAAKRSEIVGMLPMIVMMSIQEGKQQFNAIPEEMLKAQIEAQLTKAPIKEIEKAALEGIEKTRAEKAAQKEAAKNAAPGEIVSEADAEAYMAECAQELGEEGFVAFSKGVRQAFPTRTVAFFDEISKAMGNPADPEEAARVAYKKLVKTGKLEQSSDLLDKIDAKDMAKAIAEVADKVTADRVYTFAKHVVDNVDAMEVSTIATSGLDFVEDLLVAARDGNVLKLKDAKNAEKFAQAVSGTLQLVEDAFVKADLVPDTDLVAAFKKAFDAEKTTTAPKAKKVSTKPLKPHTPK